MANFERGEMEVKGKDGTGYTFALGLTARCAIEARLRSEGAEVTSYREWSSGPHSETKVLLVFWGAAQRHHADLSETAIAHLLDDAFPSSAELAAALVRLIEAAEPTDQDKKDAEAHKRPRKAQTKVNGSGGISSSKPAALA